MKKIRKINLVKTKISKVTHLQLDVLKAGVAVHQAQGVKYSQEWISMCTNDDDTCQSQTHSRTTESGSQQQNTFNKG